jgi:hypothetical protein
MAKKSGKPVLHLSLVDVRGATLDEPCLVRLTNLLSGEVRQVRNTPGKLLTITNLKGKPNGLYRVEVDPLGYLSTFKNIDLESSGPTLAEMVFAIDRSRVSQVRFPSFAELQADAKALLVRSANVRTFDGKKGEALYRALDDIRKAGFLNIVAKTRVTAARPGQSVLSQLQEVVDLRGDRCFCVVPHSLRDDTKNAVNGGLFRTVDGGLHHFEDDYSPAGSFKTPDRYGNLQLTFFASTKEDRWVADIDIDDAGGIEHVFQVVRNTVTGEPTHPYDIQQILIRYQAIDPAYTLHV